MIHYIIMKHLYRRLPYSWTADALWNISNGLFRVTVKAPENLIVPKMKYWATYNPEFHDFTITGTEIKMEDYYIEDGTSKTHTSKFLTRG